MTRDDYISGVEAVCAAIIYGAMLVDDRFNFMASPPAEQVNFAFTRPEEAAEIARQFIDQSFFNPPPAPVRGPCPHGVPLLTHCPVCAAPPENPPPFGFATREEP
jgi:hypothetical protein